MKRNGGLSQSFLPDELMGEILLRLPVRSLLRFKCVCKSWLSLISDPQFAESQFDLGAAATHRVIRLINDFQVTSIDADDDSSAAVVFNTPVPERARPRFAIIGGSCRGFLLLELLSYVDFFDLVVWNPSTGLQRRVHGINMLDWYPHLCGIGYDPSTDDYVVVVVTLPRFAARHQQPYTVVNCFSLRANSWSFTQSYNLMYIDHDPEFCQGEFLNGALHWLVRSEDELRVIIVAFDVREKKLLEIPLPRDLAAAAQSESESETYLIYHLTSMGGCLCFCLQRNRNNGTIVHEMWTMKEYKVHSSWTKSFFPSTSSNHRLHLKYPICFTKNGEILALNGCVRLVRIDDKGEDRPHGKHVSSLGINQHGIYTETLLSLPGDDFDKLSQ